MNALQAKQTFTDPVRTHVEMLHDLAAGIDGVFVVSAYNVSLPKGGGTITKHNVGDVNGMVEAIAAHSDTPGANVYTGLHLMKTGLARGKRGTRSDVVAVLGLVADMDADTGNAGNLPFEPSYIIETSPGNQQPVWLFDKPLTVTEAVPLAAALKRATGSDHGTADVDHVWRIPGTKNWPNEAKLKRGRSAEPAPVRYLHEWRGDLMNVDELRAALEPWASAPANEAKPVQLGELPDIDGVVASPKLAALLAADDVEDRSKHASRVVEQMMFDGHDVETAAALFLSASGNWSARYQGKGARDDFARMWGKFQKPDYSGLADGLLRKSDPPIAANDNEPKSRFNLTWFDDIEADKPKAWVIKNVLGRGEHTLISGLPGTGKSVVATDGACHVAAGMEWFGRKTTQGLVLFVAAERKALTERRMMAFRKHHGVKDVPLLVLGGRLDLTSSLADAKALAGIVQQAEIDCGQKCVWIIIDTLTRVFGAGDQNTSKDMGRFIQACDELIRLTGAHVTVVHHTAWSGERGKGAIDLDGAVDASFMVVKNSGTYTLKCDGANDGDEGTIATFTMQSVELAKDEDGEPTTAPVVVPGESLADRLALKGHTKGVLAALNSIIEDDGIEPEGSDFPEGIMVVKEKQWRAAYYEAESGASVETLKKRFGRAKKDLLAKGQVKQIGQWYWPS
ncbi:RecA-family ATPase-like protein [Nitrobacter hamburgensis X14]|uniref:RecA-family ATPase-like protein n=1 Tax=Nitrobacter hamburgensis (strain DSM 10229 / NCIMB 13809 / X14) TaxID=323097 RepID=Q1QRA8_NITHX|nr:AAA family ATPase [Nitrobacter hamburgensis]ABE61239.1 RecA-family ATPase-like protein [Nitrobacter hamburgensis X14]